MNIQLLFFVYKEALCLINIMATIILACDDDGTIGKDNQLPWRIPNDLKWFRLNTYGQACVMGYNTWMSLKEKTLKDRLNIVLWRKGRLRAKQNLYFCNTLEDAKSIAENRHLFIIGGAKTIEKYGHEASRWIITHVHGSFDGDVHVSIPHDSLNKIWQSKLQKHKQIEYDFAIYKKRL